MLTDGEKYGKILENTESLTEAIKSLSKKFDSALQSDTRNQTTIEDKEPDKTEDTEFDGFSKTRWLFAMAMPVVFFAFAVLAYKLNSILFLLPAGFFVMALGYLVLLVYDHYSTRRDTFKDVASHPISASIFLATLVAMFAVGVFVADGYVPNSIRNEAGSGKGTEQHNSNSGLDQSSQDDAEQIRLDGNTNR